MRPFTSCQCTALPQQNNRSSSMNNICLPHPKSDLDKFCSSTYRQQCEEASITYVGSKTTVPKTPTSLQVLQAALSILILLHFFQNAYISAIHSLRGFSLVSVIRIVLRPPWRRARRPKPSVLVVQVTQSMDHHHYSRARVT